MKLDPKPQPAVCDRCGKTTTKYVEVQYAGAKDADGMALLLGEYHKFTEVCLSCWSVIQSCVTRAGKVQARKRVEK